MAVTILGLATREGAVEALTELLDGLIGTGATLRLYQSSFVPDENSVEADFELAEADFNTYAPAALAWSAVGVGAGGSAQAMSDNAVFTNVSGANPNLIGGAWINVTAVGPPAVDKSVYFFPFPNPVALNVPLQQMGVKIVLQHPNAPGYAILEN